LYKESFEVFLKSSLESYLFTFFKVWYWKPNRWKIIFSNWQNHLFDCLLRSNQ